MMVDRIQTEDFAAIEATLRYVQKVSMAVKYAPIPVVAAPSGACSVAGSNLSPLRPGAGDADVAWAWWRPAGPDPLRRRHQGVAQSAPWTWPGRHLAFPNLMPAFDALAQPRRAVRPGSLRHELPAAGARRDHEPGSVIYALSRWRSGCRGGLQPPMPGEGQVMGRTAQQLPQHPLQHGQTSSSRSTTATWVRSSPGAERRRRRLGTEVDEWYLLALDGRPSSECAARPRTLERIQHMLATGKPLRN